MERWRPAPERVAADFVMGGAAAVAAKSGAAPLERVKLLLQNQGEMVKRGRLSSPYAGISNCAFRILRDEGSLAFWRGNQANVIRYFPTQDKLTGRMIGSGHEEEGVYCLVQSLLVATCQGEVIFAVGTTV